MAAGLQQSRQPLAEAPQGMFSSIRSVGGPVTSDLAGGHAKRYSVIYADPPWSFENYSEAGEDRNAKSWYDCMSIEDIYAMPVADLAAPDCALFLWVTDPMLPEGIETMRRWGFRYVTVAFDWIKLNKSALGPDNFIEGANGQRLGSFAHANDTFMSTGYWTRKNPERILIGTRGEPIIPDNAFEDAETTDCWRILMGSRGSPKRLSRSVRQVVFAPRAGHSEKPLIFREEIERLVAAENRIELFCRREPAPGWDAWGNQVGALEAGTITKRKKLAAVSSTEGMLL